MWPEPEEGLRTLGSIIRAGRLARRLTQQQAARGAKVSRGQLALAERGGNVSVKFLLKIARFLALPDISFDGAVRIAAESKGVHVGELLRAIDLISAVAEDLRSIALNVVFETTDGGRLEDTPLVKEFLARHAGEEGLSRLAEAVLRPLSSEAPPSPPPRLRADEQKETAGPGRRRRAG